MAACSSRMAASFQSTLSMRRATYGAFVEKFKHKFQSTLSMRRATAQFVRQRLGRGISIHALHEESDMMSGGRPARNSVFQSTLSMRRATVQLDIFVRFLRRKPAA